MAGQAVNSGNEIKDINDFIRPNNPVFGKKDAPITILAFIDFECPYSSEAYADFKKIMSKYEPVIRVIFKNLPLINLHPDAMVAAEAGMCANEQNKFWPYYDLLFTKKDLENNPFVAYAEELGLNQDKFSICLGEEKYLPQITQDVSDAVSLGLRGTPTYFVNGAIIEGNITEADWDKVILQFLNK